MKPVRSIPLAVALAYEAPSAPKVVAIGRGALGEAIIETAREHGVPLEENPALAEALSRVELDDEIPEALFRAVAEIIGFILSAGAEAAPTLRP
jgi:flagellar biosynthesis protein